mmetsp:Transcript_72907/g.144908  ORF Transcript_72907/g.144908 Transcript_72907/m.144908 type:complete len:216 (-) Transcript_72907:166-813(-)
MGGAGAAHGEFAQLLQALGRRLLLLRVCGRRLVRPRAAAATACRCAAARPARIFRVVLKVIGAVPDGSNSAVVLARMEEPLGASPPQLDEAFEPFEAVPTNEGSCVGTLDDRGGRHGVDIVRRGRAGSLRTRLRFDDGLAALVRAGILCVLGDERHAAPISGVAARRYPAVRHYRAPRRILITHRVSARRRVGLLAQRARGRRRGARQQQRAARR